MSQTEKLGLRIFACSVLVFALVCKASAQNADNPALDKLLAAVAQAKEAQKQDLAAARADAGVQQNELDAKQAEFEGKEAELNDAEAAQSGLLASREKFIGNFLNSADPAANQDAFRRGLEKLDKDVEAAQAKLDQLRAAARDAQAQRDAAQSALDAGAKKIHDLENARCVPCDDLADHVASEAAKKKAPPPVAKEKPTPAKNPPVVSRQPPVTKKPEVTEDVIVEEEMIEEYPIEEYVEDSYGEEEDAYEEDIVMDEEYVDSYDEEMVDDGTYDEAISDEEMVDEGISEEAMPDEGSFDEEMSGEGSYEEEMPAEGDFEPAMEAEESFDDGGDSGGEVGCK